MKPFTCALVAAFCWGLSSIVEKWGLRNTDPSSGLVARSAGVLLGTALFMGFTPELLKGFTGLTWGARLALMAGGLLASVLGQVFFYRALKDGEVGPVAAVGGSWPLIAFALSMVFLGETINPQKALGIALVALGVFFLR